MLSKLVVALVLAWGSGLASWDGVGEPGGTWDGGLRSLIWPPWKVLLTVDPLERREEGVEDEEEAPEAPAMLWVEGDAGGRRWDKELGRERVGGKKRKVVIHSQNSFRWKVRNCAEITYFFHLKLFPEPPSV